MPEGDTAELIASILVTLGGTLASAYLAKKLIDAMDMSKKVRLMRLVHLRMWTTQRSRIPSGYASERRKRDEQSIFRITSHWF